MAIKFNPTTASLDLVNSNVASSTEPFVTIGNTSGLSAERALTGTTNQVLVTDNGAGSTVVLSTPQDIGTISSPTFANITISTLATLSSTSGSSAGGLSFAGDTTLYRRAAGSLKTDGGLVTGSNIGILVNSPSFNLGFGGTAARTIGVERATSGAGNSMTISAGGAQLGATDTAGGIVAINGGTNTGNSQGGGVALGAPVPGSTGTSDAAATTRFFIPSTTNAKILIGNSNTTVLDTNDGLNLLGTIQQYIYHKRHTTSNTAGNDFNFIAGGATSGATDKNGGSAVVSGGISTGTGESIVYLKTATPGSTGTTDRSPTIKMTVRGSGNVGIGTTNPANLLEVLSTTTPQFRVSYDTSNYATFDVSSLGILTITPTAGALVTNTISATRNTTVTTLTQAVITAQAKTSNDMADGFGATFRFDIQDNAGVQNNIAQIGGRRDGADNQGAMTFLIVDGAAGLIEAGRFNHLQNFGIGTTTPETKLHIAKASGTGGHGSITIEEEASTPSDPTSGTHVRMYMKADKLIFQYNDGGTVRYKYLDLTGTGVTWTHTTTAP